MATPDNMPETSLPNVHCYESLLEGQSTEFEWPELDERAACALCYTSGTTGNPKGVLQSSIDGAAYLRHPYARRVGYVRWRCGHAHRAHNHGQRLGQPLCLPVAGCKMVMPANKMGMARLWRHSLMKRA